MNAKITVAVGTALAVSALFVAMFLTVSVVAVGVCLGIQFVLGSGLALGATIAAKP